MSYWLLDTPNPAAPWRGDGQYWGYATMASTPRVIVVHTAESTPDITPPDNGAENVAAYLARTTVPSSYHTIVDSDTCVRLLPAGLDGTTVHTAFHCYGYNSSSLGVSFATRAADWPGLPPAWTNSALGLAAAEVALWCRRWNIPATVIDKAEVDHGGSGITSHGALNPGDRSDPGPAFPWASFLAKVRAAMTDDPTPNPITEDDDMAMRTWVTPDGTRYIGDANSGASRTAQDALPAGCNYEAVVAELVRCGAMRDHGRVSWEANWALRTSATWTLEV